MELIAKIFFKIFEATTLTFTGIILFLSLLGLIIIPPLWVYYLFKSRKNKDEFFKNLIPGLLLIIFLIISYYAGLI